MFQLTCLFLQKSVNIFNIYVKENNGLHRFHLLPNYQVSLNWQLYTEIISEKVCISDLLQHMSIRISETSVCSSINIHPGGNPCDTTTYLSSSCDFNH